MMKEVLRLGLTAILGSGVTFTTDVTDVLDELEVPYSIVKEIPQGADMKGFYEYSTGKIYIDSDVNTEEMRYIAAHELIHKLRYEQGLWTGDESFEEAVAVYGAIHISRKIGFGRFSIDKKDTLKLALKAGGLDPAYKPDIDQVYAEVDKTLEVLKDFKLTVKGE